MTTPVNQAMDEAVGRGVFPSATLLVAKEGDIIHRSHHGDAREGTTFDIASLTKPISTATLAMLLAADGALDPQAALTDWFDDAKQPPLSDITLAMLLNHTSGLPAWRPFYRELPSNLVATPEGKEHIVRACLGESLEHAPGAQTVYSDLGFILLGEIIERVSGKPLDVLFADRVANPLGLADTLFIKNQGVGPNTTTRRTDTTPGQHVPTRSSVASKTTDGYRRRFAATEDCPWRNHVIHGEVHDQNAFAMGGVAGHAGLFSTALDIHIFITAFMKSFTKEGGLIPEGALETFFTLENGLIAPPQAGVFMGGWDTPSARNSAAGHHASKHSIGHLAYTGCSIWIDQEQKFWVILLTNRIHPSTTNEKIKAFRPQIHDLIYTTLINS